MTSSLLEHINESLKLVGDIYSERRLEDIFLKLSERRPVKWCIDGSVKRWCDEGVRRRRLLR